MMLYSIIFIVIMILGGLAALLAIFFGIIALVRQSRTMLLIGLVIAAIPLLLYALVCWMYQ